MSLRVVVAGGGTAGHVYPGLAVARALRERGHEVSFVGTGLGMESRLVPEAGFPFQAVPARPFVRAVSPRALAGPAATLAAVGPARRIVRGADVVVGMGGYASLPAGVAARLERIPLVCHEQNAVPGLANRLLARLARTVALGFAGAAERLPRGARTVVTGNPVREEIAAVAREREALAPPARAELGLEPGRFTVLAFGGSLGALHLDRAVAEACRLLVPRGDLQVLLITGAPHLDAVRAELPVSGALRVRALGFLDRMQLAYAVADLVLARGGAGSIAEITACGLPSILVPYPHAAAGEQEANARAVEQAGAAEVLLDGDLSGPTVAERIDAMMRADERRARMRAAAASFGRPDAAVRLADVVAGAPAERRR